MVVGREMATQARIALEIAHLLLAGEAEQQERIAQAHHHGRDMRPAVATNGGEVDPLGRSVQGVYGAE